VAAVREEIFDVSAHCKVDLAQLIALAEFDEVSQNVLKQKIRLVQVVLSKSVVQDRKWQESHFYGVEVATRV
jgi:hypothetical protein